MPFLFSYVCDLLQRLDDNRLARSGLRSNFAIIQEWFRAHQGLLSRDDHNSAPLLSALLPEKRTDRVYFIREKKLQIIIGRALGLGRSRIAELGRWNNPEARVDLADCVESILKQTVTCHPWILASNLPRLRPESQTLYLRQTELSQWKRLIVSSTALPPLAALARLRCAAQHRRTAQQTRSSF